MCASVLGFNMKLAKKTNYFYLFFTWGFCFLFLWTRGSKNRSSFCIVYVEIFHIANWRLLCKMCLEIFQNNSFLDQTLARETLTCFRYFSYYDMAIILIMEWDCLMLGRMIVGRYIRGLEICSFCMCNSLFEFLYKNNSGKFKVFHIKYQSESLACVAYPAH